MAAGSGTRAGTGFPTAALLLSLAACGQTARNPADGGGAAAGAGGGAAISGSDGGGAASGGAGGALAPRMDPPAPVEGEWIVYGFEDPYSVRIETGGVTEQGGLQLSGVGCYSGPPQRADCPGFIDAECGPTFGTVEGARVRFSTSFASSSYTYATDVFATADGQRMAGAFFSHAGTGELHRLSTAVGWVRVERLGFDGTCDPAPSPFTPLGPRESWHFSARVALQGDARFGSLEPGVPYKVLLSSFGGRSVLVGDVGAYFHDDLAWDAASRALTAGPVEPTVPGWPVKLVVRMADDVSVLDVVATDADGATAILAPVPEPPER